MNAFIPIGPEPAVGEPLPAPFDGEDVLDAVDIATVVVVRNAWWDSGVDWEDRGHSSYEYARGWWAQKNSVTQEKLEGIYAPTHWAPMPDLPEELG